MPTKDPTTWSMATWALVMSMSMLGGITSWYQRVKNGHTRAFNVIEFIGEIATSALMGFVGFTTCVYFSDNVGIASAVGGMSAHFSTRLMFQAEGLLTILAKRLEERAGKL